LGKRACPIYRQLGPRRFEIIGTAVPVKDQKHAALLTAAHVLNQVEDGQVLIGGSHKFLRFPVVTAKFTHSQHAPAVDIDVAAIALPAKFASELSEFYEFAGPPDIGEFETYDKFTLYVFVGFPHAKNRLTHHKPGEPRIKPYFYVVREYAELGIDARKRAATHVTFQAPFRSVPRVNGVQLTPPDPHGLSGCGVWKMKFDRGTGNSSQPQLVGIGIEYVSQPGLFVATRVQAGLVAVSELWRELKESKLQNRTIEFREAEQ